MIAYIKQELPSPQIIILGNKADDINHRINQDIINKNLNQYKEKNIKYIEVSAKTDKNINLALQKLIDLIEENYKGNIEEDIEEEDIKEEDIGENNDESTKKKCCWCHCSRSCS